VTPGPGSLTAEARAANGGPAAAATVHLVERGLRARLRRAAIFLVIGCLGLVLLPVPGVHFFGVAVFVAGLAVAVQRVRTPIVVGGAEGTCPACGHAGRWFAGTGWRPVRWPLVTSCPSCKVELRLTPAP
jgi:hypothetical protein